VKIRIEKGVAVDLDKTRRTSVKGGVYDISKLPEKRQKELLKIKGVSEVKETAATASKKKEA
jgi:hypothetical protein